MKPPPPRTTKPPASGSMRHSSPALLPLTPILTCWVALTLSMTTTLAQELEILSLSRNGVIAWTNSSLNVTCHVEWASSLDGPWNRSWDSLKDIVVTNHVTECSIPMFFRVVQSAPTPVIENISAADALALIQSHELDDELVILDVRTPAEFASRHIKEAQNLDFFSATFEEQLAVLNKSKPTLVYCASGSRSGQAVQVMEELGFLEVYNMLGGIGGFASLSGADAYLEP